ncbi:DUF488 family protein, N3 subclade [Natronorubrum thiooxidans]|uniref:DUF488 domain-containing protein n=1 Tax=Natronorubrum thiooxidans TaxID=308853 RepID=A0A1N7CAW8_9EURY|nr:DUF488 family protein [Natronorubrum thiooxidans]SIR60755.1 Protein of unknown function, DUF488 [Natronorubrum thiooxidans]
MDCDIDGALTDASVTAIQHDLAPGLDDATLIGVVRNPDPWFHAAVDENVPELGPPADLLEAMHAAEADLKMRGLCAEGAHNAAWDQVEFEQRYRECLEHSADTQAAIANLRERLESGESLALVCDENTEKKRCHRTILRARLERAMSV